MDLQTWLSLAVVGSAAAYLTWRGWRTWSQAQRGCGGCGCSKATARIDEPRLIPANELTVRRSPRR